ncbi:MAG: ATP-grasp domain-containing protein, partial [Candidatus Bathyarchaeota archaeon]|nr:ATP-grasp domain-containing protein [Candidatus Bathyarchaeota archaeon]
MLIKDLNSLKRFFKKIKRPILGAGVYAFNRLGPEEFVSNYQILSLYSSKEIELIKGDIPVFCLEEKVKNRLRPRNSSTLISHPETQEYISKFQDPLILFYQSSGRIEEAASQHKFKTGISPYRFGKQFFEDKIKFREILQEIHISPTPGRVFPFSSLMSLQFSQIGEEFGLPFVLQHPKRGGGEGTFFIKDEDDFRKSKESLYENPTEEIIVAKFIDGLSPSVTGCVTRYGILSTRPQYQICDVPILYSRPTCSGLFCGHDWSASEFSPNILLQAQEIIGKIGNYFRKLGYLGVFGIDFVEDRKEEKLYVTECNPRLLGSMPVLTMTEIENDIPPIVAFHILEYLEIPYEIDVKRILQLLWRKREGAQMILY